MVSEEMDTRAFKDDSLMKGTAIGTNKRQHPDPEERPKDGSVPATAQRRLDLVMTHSSFEKILTAVSLPVTSPPRHAEAEL